MPRSSAEDKEETPDRGARRKSQWSPSSTKSPKDRSGEYDSDEAAHSDGSEQFQSSASTTDILEDEAGVEDELERSEAGVDFDVDTTRVSRAHSSTQQRQASSRRKSVRESAKVKAIFVWPATEGRNEGYTVISFESDKTLRAQGGQACRGDVKEEFDAILDDVERFRQVERPLRTRDYLYGLGLSSRLQLVDIALQWSTTVIQNKTQALTLTEKYEKRLRNEDNVLASTKRLRQPLHTGDAIHELGSGLYVCLSPGGDKEKFWLRWRINAITGASKSKFGRRRQEGESTRQFAAWQAHMLALVGKIENKIEQVAVDLVKLNVDDGDVAKGQHLASPGSRKAASVSVRRSPSGNHTGGRRSTTPHFRGHLGSASSATMSEHQLKNAVSSKEVDGPASARPDLTHAEMMKEKGRQLWDEGEHMRQKEIDRVAAENKTNSKRQIDGRRSKKAISTRDVSDETNDQIAAASRRSTRTVGNRMKK